MESNKWMLISDKPKMFKNKRGELLFLKGSALKLNFFPLETFKTYFSFMAI